MPLAPPAPPYGPVYTPPLVAALAGASTAIARLDARLTVSPVAAAWAGRAVWSGYARALQLQGAAVDEIEVFSHGCGLPLPHRPPRPSHLDLFDRLPGWQAALRDGDRHRWRDTLPSAITAPAGAADHPPLIRALETIRQLARHDTTLGPWLALPFALRDRGLTATPLPCLAGGTTALRRKSRPDGADWRAVLRSLDTAATLGLERLHALERHYRDAQRALAAAYRPGALPALLALSQQRPLVSPRSVAAALSLSLAGASKLLDRGAAAGLLVEITQRRSWRLFLTPDLALAFGYARPPRGRPAHEAPPLPVSGQRRGGFAAFDAEMEAIDHLLASLPPPAV